MHFAVLKKTIVFFLTLTAIVTLLPQYQSLKAQSNPLSQEQEGSFQPKAAMEIKPILNEIAAKPGETIERDMTVTSLANIPLPIKAYSRAFVATDEQGGSEYPDEKKADSVQNWFKLAEPDFILQPKASKVIKVKVEIPKDARPGGHYATLFYESLIPKEVLSETSFYLSSRIGALFFFVIGGDIKEQGQIKEFSTLPFWRHENIDFNVTFENNGNVHIRPRSVMTITDWRGNEVDKIEDKGNTTLPEKNRKWTITWTKKPWIGKYTAKLETKIDQDAPTQTRLVQFYVFPSIEFGLAFAAGLIILFVIRGRQRIMKAGKALAGKNTETNPHDKFKL